jgi:hypothetical protein
VASVGGADRCARERAAKRRPEIPCSAGNNREFDSGFCCTEIASMAGALAWDRVALPFGETWSAAGPRTTSLRFPGQVHDPETGPAKSTRASLGVLPRYGKRQEFCGE